MITRSPVTTTITFILIFIKHFKHLFSLFNVSYYVKDEGTLNIQAKYGSILSSEIYVECIWLYDTLTQDNGILIIPEGKEVSYTSNGIRPETTGAFTLNKTLPNSYQVELLITERPSIPLYQWGCTVCIERFCIFNWQNRGVIRNNGVEKTNSARVYNAGDTIKLTYDASTQIVKYYINDSLVWTENNVAQTNTLALRCENINYKFRFKNLKIKQL